MPPPKDKPNPLAAPGDDFTETIHSDTYPAIDSSKADLRGKSVFIAGASKGIGRAIALSYARAGASYIAIGARSDLTSLEKEIVQAAALSKGISPKILQIKLDVTDQKNVQNAANDVERNFGHLDTVIYNAGILVGPSLITDSDPETWWRNWDVNIRGPFLIARSFVPLLLKGGDKQFCIVSSVGAFLVKPGLSAYQSSKMASLRLTEFIDAEYAQQGLICWCIHPGNIPGTDIFGPGASVSEDIKHIFTETTELPADSIVWMTAEKRAWLGARYISCTWDMLQLEAKKDEIVERDMLKLKLVV